MTGQLKRQKRRLSVSLSEDDYNRLKTLADSRRPQLTMRYVVDYAIQLLLQKAEDPHFVAELGDPLHGKTTEG